MGERNMISGIKRKITAIESTYRYFQTVDLLLNHFKREADREKIFELINSIKNKNNLKDHLIATAAIHLYHNFGIRVNENIEFEEISVDSTKSLELKEKEMLFKEVALILKDSLKLETDLLIKSINFENKIISFLIEIRNPKINELQKKKILEEIDGYIEQNLMEIVLNYPPFCFYDFLGDLIGLTNQIKSTILEESSDFKDLSVEIEKKLKAEEKEDKFIELSTLNKLIERIQNNFEFKSYKDLQMQTMSMRMIKRKITDYNFNRFPISIPGLNRFLEANKLKTQLVEKINSALEEKIDYDNFEKEILQFIKTELIKQLKTNPNDFIYFLQNLYESNLKETFYLLNKYGIFNILDIVNIDFNLINEVKRNLIRYNIDKFNIIDLNNETKDVILLVKTGIINLGLPFINDLMKKNKNLNEFSVENLLNGENENLKILWQKIEENTGISLNTIRQYVQKKKIIDNVFLTNLKLNSYSQILTILNFEDIIENIAKEIFYYIFSKVLRQLSRIIEIYLKISNEKPLYLLALKKMYGTTETEEWVWIKLEELIIERIIKLQKELVIVFNALNQPFLINGFIYSKLTDKSLDEGFTELNEKASPIFKDIKNLPLKADLISPVSYCIAYDLTKRFEEFEEMRKQKIENVKKQEDKKQEDKKIELRKQQEISTLNWIERKITSSLMRINSPGINPNQLYWQEKDTKIATDNIKLHSELKGNSIDLFQNYFEFAIEKIKEVAPEIKVPDKKTIYNTILEIIEKALEKRLGHVPSSNEIQDILEGERVDISKQIAIKIGRILDKALYTKFKKKS